MTTSCNNQTLPINFFSIHYTLSKINNRRFRNIFETVNVYTLQYHTNNLHGYKVRFFSYEINCDYFSRYGPRAGDLIHLGAKFAPCMRVDNKIKKEIDKIQAKERETACCIRNDDSGCVQSSQADCSVSITLFVSVCIYLT